MSDKKDIPWHGGIDWAQDVKLDAFKVTKVESKPASMADTIICDQKVKEQIEEALRGDMVKLLDNAEKRVFAPGGHEITFPIKVMTVPGMDLSKAFLINPGQMSNMFSTPQYNAMYGPPNKNGDAYPLQAFGEAMQQYRAQHAMQFYQLPAQAIANVGAVSIGAISGLGSRWGPRVRADINERCEMCENSLICNTYDVCPVVCMGCKRRYFMHEDDVEVPTTQICLGFDWKKAKQDFQCNACVQKVLHP